MAKRKKSKKILVKKEARIGWAEKRVCWISVACLLNDQIIPRGRINNVVIMDQIIALYNPNCTWCKDFSILPGRLVAIMFAA